MKYELRNMRSLVAIAAVMLTNGLLWAQPDCDTPNGTFPVVPPENPSLCDVVWGVDVDANGDYTWVSNPSGTASACWNALAWYYGVNQDDVPENPYRDDGTGNGSPIMTEPMFCGLNLGTDALSIQPPHGFAAPFNLLAPPGIGDFLPPASTLSESSSSLIPPGMAGESTWWNDASRQSLNGSVDLVTGLPLIQVDLLDLPFDGANFRLTRTRSNHRRDQVGFGGGDGRYPFDYMTASERWWDWSGQGWMVGENPLLIVDSSVPDLVGNNPKTTWLVLDAHHSIPFQQIESTGVYAAPPRFRAKLVHNGVWGAGEWTTPPTQMEVYLYDGALKYTFVVIREDVPDHVWDQTESEVGNNAAELGSLHDRPFLTDQFPVGSDYYKSWNPFYSCSNPGLGLPYLGLCVEINDNYGHQVQINYHGVKQQAVDYDGTGRGPESTETDGSTCVECGQSCARKGMIQSVKLKTNGQTRWSLIYIYRGFYNHPPVVDEAFFAAAIYDVDDPHFREQDLWGSYHIDRIYAFENMDPEPDIIAAAGSDYFLKVDHDDMLDLEGDGPDPLYDLLGQSSIANKWTHYVQNHFAPRLDANGYMDGVNFHALKLMTEVRSRTYEDNDTNLDLSFETVKRWVYHHQTPQFGQPVAIDAQLPNALQWELYWISRIYTPEDVADVLSSTSLTFGTDSTPTPMTLRDLVYMTDPRDTDWSNGPTSLSNDKDKLGVIAGYATYRFGNGKHTNDQWPSSNGSPDAPNQTILVDQQFLVNDVAHLMTDMRAQVVGRAAIPDERGTTRYYQINRLRVVPMDFIWVDPSSLGNDRRFVSEWHSIGEEMNFRSAFVAPYQWHAYTPAFEKDGSGWPDTSTSQSPDLTAVRWITIIDEYSDERDLFPSLDDLNEGWGKYDGTHSTKPSQISRRVVELSPSGYLLRDRKWEFDGGGVIRSGGGLGEQYIYRTIEHYFEDDLGQVFPDAPAPPSTSNPGNNRVHDALSAVRNELLNVEYRSVGWSAAQLDEGIDEDTSGFTRFTQYAAFHPSGESWSDYVNSTNTEASEEAIPLQTRVQPVARGIRRGSLYTYNDSTGLIEPTNNLNHRYMNQFIRDPEVPSQVIAHLEFIESTEQLENFTTILQELETPNWQTHPVNHSNFRMQRTVVERGDELDDDGNLLPEEEQPVLSRMVIGFPHQVYPSSDWYYPVEREFYDDEGNPTWSCTGQLRNPAAPDTATADAYESLTFTFYVRDDEGRSVETVLDADLSISPISSNPNGDTITIDAWPTDASSVEWKRIPQSTTQDPALSYVTSFVYDDYAPGLCDIYYPNGRRWARRVARMTSESEYDANMDEYAREFIFNNLELRMIDGSLQWVTTSEGEVKDYRSMDVFQRPLVTRKVTYVNDTIPYNTGASGTLRVSSTSQPDWVIKTAIEMGVDSTGRLQQASLLERSPTGALLAVGSKLVNDLGELYREEEIDGTVTAQTRNSLGQTLRVYQGTEDRRWYLPQSEWATVPSPDMILLERTEYGGGVNDAWLPTVVRTYDRKPSESWLDDRYGEVLPSEDTTGQATVIHYDWRQRPVRTDVYEAGVYGDDTQANPRRLSTSLVFLDFLDRPYIEVTYGEDPLDSADGGPLSLPASLDPSTYIESSAFPVTGGEPDITQLFELSTGLDPKSVAVNIYSIDGSIVERRTYDTGWDGSNQPTYLAEFMNSGRGGTPIFSQSPEGNIEIIQMDSLGRVKSNASMVPSTQQYSSSNLPVNLKELTRTDYVYDTDGNVVETKFWERVEDTGQTLDGMNAIRTRTLNWYDVQKRLVATAELGTEDDEYRYTPEQYAHTVPGPGDDWSQFVPPTWDESLGEVVFDSKASGDPMYALKDAMVRVYGYDDTGNKVLSVDPEGVLTRFEYTATNRLLYKIENAADAAWVNQRMTGYRYEYGRLIEMNLITVDNRILPNGGSAPPVTGDFPVTGGGMTDAQYGNIEEAHRTRLEYGAVIVGETAAGGYQPVSTNNKLIGAMHLPNEQTGEPADDADVFLRYTFSGQIALRFNSAGEAIKYLYDDLGRLIVIEIGTWDPTEPPDFVDIDPIDPTTIITTEPTEKIRYIEYSYDHRGNLSDVMAWTAKDPADRQLIAHTRMAYDARDRLEKEYQLHGEGPLDESKTPYMQYAWEYEPTDLGQGAQPASTGHDRLIAMTYPVPSNIVNPRTITLGYGTAGSETDLLSRVIRFSSNIGTPVLADFEYSGSGRRVATRLKNSKINNDSDYSPQSYPVLNGYDRYGRDNESRWVGLSESAVLYRADYTFDKVGNRTSARIQQADVAGQPRDNMRSVLSSYDRLHRLVGAQVGQLDLTDPSSPVIAQGTEIHSDSWSLDLLGNWTGEFDDQTGDVVSYGRYIEGTLDDFGVPWSLASHDDYSTYTFGMNQSVTQRDTITQLGIFEQVDTDPEQNSTKEPVYDKAGRTLFDGTYAYQYDAWGRVVQVNEATLETDPITNEEYIEFGTMLKQYVYDGLGRLIRTTSPYPDPITADPETGTGVTRSINFYYDGARRVQEVINEEVLGMGAALNSGDPGLEQLAASSSDVSNPDGLSTPQSLEKGQNPDPSYSRDIHREYVWGPGDQGPDELLLQTDESDAEYWCLMDGGGDLVALVSVSGQSVSVVRQWTYDAYGAILTAEDLGPSLVTHVGHKGLFVDRLDVGVEEGGGESPRLLPYAHTLYQNRNRSYSPSLGRFLQPDPNQTAMALLSTTASHGRGFGAISIAFSMEGMYGDGMNLYQYLGSNPWTNSDPLGLSSDPFAEIDAIIDEIMAERAGALSSIGKEAAATAIIAAQIASYLPFPGIGIAGDLALVALGQESIDNVLIGAAIGIIPGGKLVKLLKKSDVFQHLGKIGGAAWSYAKRMAGGGGGFLGRVAGGLADRAKRFLDRKPKAIACGCFTASTLVWTANGAVPIGDIQAGEQVFSATDDGLSQDYSSNEVGTKIIIGEASLVQLLVLHEDGERETINTTDEHPFHVADTNAWTRADRLQVGDRLSTITGTAELLGVVYTTERVPVYNLSIPGSPTYYVGEHGVWVHNCWTGNHHLIPKYIGGLAEGGLEFLGHEDHVLLHSLLDKASKSRGIPTRNQGAKKINAWLQNDPVNNVRELRDALMEAYGAYDNQKGTSLLPRLVDEIASQGF